MKHLLCISTFAAVIFATSAAQSQVVINEFSYDDQGGDSSEFVELYNTTASPINLTGWSLAKGPTTSGTQALTQTIPANGYVLLTSSVAAASTGVGNLSDGTYTGNLGNAENWLALLNGTSLIDSVVYNRGTNTILVPNGYGEPASDGVTTGSSGGIFANHIMWDTGTANAGIRTSGTNASLSLQRRPTVGLVDTNNNERDFVLGIATPKAANLSLGTVSPATVASSGVTYDFSAADGTAETNLPGNYSSVTCQDPTVADTTLSGNASPNPNAIPASPNGGNVGVCWGLSTTANSGLGNVAILNLNDTIADVEAESYVYIPAALNSSTANSIPDYEVGNWFVLRGRPDSFYFQTDEVVTNVAPNGDVGVRLRFENNLNASGQFNIFLDYKADGTTTTLAGPIQVTTPGWYRVLLSVQGTKVAAIIGGTYGSSSTDGNINGGGLRLPAVGTYTTTLTTPGGVGMNYHCRNLSGSQLAIFRPLTYDHLTFRAPNFILSKVEDWSMY